MASIVFLTVFLGLTYDVHSVTVRVADPVKAVTLILDGARVATITGPPWTADVDFGKELAPHSLIAVAQDASGAEVARASQMLNMAPVLAAIDVSVEGDPAATRVSIVGHHRTYRPIKKAQLTIDGKPVTLDKQYSSVADLRGNVHLLSASAIFDDGSAARKEVVIQNGIADRVETELSPLLVMVIGNEEPTRLDGCFLLDEKPVRATALETLESLVTVVKDPDTKEIRSHLRDKVLPLEFPSVSAANRGRTRFPDDTMIHFVWPVHQTYTASGEAAVSAFAQTAPLPAYQYANAGSDRRGISYAGGVEQYSQIGFMLVVPRSAATSSRAPRSFNDAVAVAGMGSLQPAQRRAVILLASARPEASALSIDVVRRYLDRVDVPLFVWYVDEKSKEAAARWGPAMDVATPLPRMEAVDAIGKNLARQRIAWVATDPISALRVLVNPHCGISRLATAAANAAAAD